MVPRDPARNVAAKEAVAARIVSRRGSLEAVTRSWKTMIMTRTMSPVTTSLKSHRGHVRRWWRFAAYVPPPTQAVGA